MFEISVRPEVVSQKVLKKTPDSVLIIDHIKRSGNKAMRAGLKKITEGTCVLDISKKFIDARHGKVCINYRFDFVTPELKEQRENSIL